MQVLSSLLHRYQLLILRVQTVQLCKKYGCRKSVSTTEVRTEMGRGGEGKNGGTKRKNRKKKKKNRN